MSLLRSWDFAHADVELGKELSPEDHKFEHEVELMQFTGLLDKNGKEIYEGDIIELDGYKYEILFIDGEYCGKSMLSEQLQMFEIVNGEVIGNIYENPDLIK